MPAVACSMVYSRGTGRTKGVVTSKSPKQLLSMADQAAHCKLALVFAKQMPQLSARELHQILQLDLLSLYHTCGTNSMSTGICNLYNQDFL